MLTLGYWNIRSIGEPIRLMLEYAGADYEDKRYSTLEAWLADKQGLGLDFPNLPYLFDGEINLTESWAIMKYLARKYDLQPAQGQEYLADMLQGVAEDFRRSFMGVCHDDYEAECGEYFGKTIPAKLDLFEVYLAKHQWIAGSNLTYVDFAFCEVLNQMMLANDAVLSGHEKVLAYLLKFENLDMIKAYRESTRFKKMPCNGPFAKWGANAE